ncbi:unnamed protein product [Arctogadus glacialis]
MGAAQFDNPFDVHLAFQEDCGGGGRERELERKPAPGAVLGRDGACCQEPWEGPPAASMPASRHSGGLVGTCVDMEGPPLAVKEAGASDPQECLESSTTRRGEHLALTSEGTTGAHQQSAGNLREKEIDLKDGLINFFR